MIIYAKKMGSLTDKLQNREPIRKRVLLLFLQALIWVQFGYYLEIPLKTIIACAILTDNQEENP
jgi:hypothetical protein